MGTKVKNKKGTESLKCNCVSWLAHWERFSKQKASNCSVMGCWDTDLVGAHVNQVYSTDYETYIVPLCRGHNKSDDILDVGSTILISSNVSKTCGKQ
jgi:hypothetical protein